MKLKYLCIMALFFAASLSFAEPQSRNISENLHDNLILSLKNKTAWHENKQLRLTLSLDQTTTHPDSSVTYTVTARLTNTTGKRIEGITFFDDILTQYNVTLNQVSTVGLVASSPLPSFGDKIFQFIYDEYPTHNVAPLSLLSPSSSLSKGESGSIIYTFTYFPLADAASQPLASHAIARGDTRHNRIETESSLPLGMSPLEPSLSPRIGIVGGGLAGLTTAYRLVQAGIKPIVYEGSNRMGGRSFSGKFPDGQIFEHGGELIDTDHTDIQDLVQELGLTLDDLDAAETPGTTTFSQVIDYDVDPPRKVRYSIVEITNDYFNTFNPQTGLTIYQQVFNDANNTYPTNVPPPGPATPWPLTYGDPALAARLDATTLDVYINDVTSFLRPDGNGSKTKLAQFLKVAYVEEFGAELNQQSALNLIYLLGFQVLPSGIAPPNVPPEFFQPFGISDEKFHIHGGTVMLVERLVEELQKAHVTIYKNTRLTKITFQGGPYQLSFSSPCITSGSWVPASFDHVVIAIPFATMRKVFSRDGKPLYGGEFVDISQANFSSLKQYAIQNLGMSRNAKLNVQFLDRYWRQEGCNGDTYATSNPNVNGGVGVEREFQNTWEVSRAQPGIKGILINYTGGNRSESITTSYKISDVKIRDRILKRETGHFLEKLDFLLPGATSHRNFVYQKGYQLPFIFAGSSFDQECRECSHECCVICLNLREKVEREKSLVNVISDNWAESPWQRGAYAYWQPGQYIAGTGEIIDGVVQPPGSVVPFAGYEGVPEPFNTEQTGTCHFAGEHTSYDNQGFLDGAVESGNRVATEILGEL